MRSLIVEVRREYKIRTNKMIYSVFPIKPVGSVYSSFNYAAIHSIKKTGLIAEIILRLIVMTPNSHCGFRL